jgi:hypothetical protein
VEEGRQCKKGCKAGIEIAVKPVRKEQNKPIKPYA